MKNLLKKIKSLSKKQKALLAGLLSLAAVFVVIAAAKKIVSSSQKGEMTFYRVRQETYENVIEISGVVSAANCGNS